MESILYVGLDVRKKSIEAALVVAPSRVPRRSGDRIKNDRRDAMDLRHQDASPGPAGHHAGTHRSDCRV